jgi:hypothetical protein
MRRLTKIALTALAVPALGAGLAGGLAASTHQASPEMKFHSNPLEPAMKLHSNPLMKYHDGQPQIVLTMKVHGGPDS